MKYVWTVDRAPRGSKATIAHARGAVAESSPFEYRYAEGEVATFTPDKAGEYTIRLSVTSLFEDAVSHEVEATAQHTLRLVANGGDVDVTADDAGGCSAAPGAENGRSALLFALLALGVVGRRRRGVPGEAGPR